MADEPHLPGAGLVILRQAPAVAPLILVGLQGAARGGWSRTRGLRHSVDVLGPVMELTHNGHPMTVLTPVYPHHHLCKM